MNVRAAADKPVRKCSCNWDHPATYRCPPKGYDWMCQRCGHYWRSHKPDIPPPRQCVRCRSAYWAMPRVRERRTGESAKRRAI